MTTTYAYDFMVYIGRFQPIHKGHLFVIEQALKQAKNVLILCGSYQRPRTPRNPWTYEERVALITQALPPQYHERVQIFPIHDYPYDDARWVHECQNIVNNAIHKTVNQSSHIPKIGITGHFKDETSYYISLFPDWEIMDMPLFKDCHGAHLRDWMFEGTLDKAESSECLPPSSLLALKAFTHTPIYAHLKEEWQVIANYKHSWKVAPYPPIFVTTDAVVIHEDAVLLIERGNHPGKGLFALPGGFLEPHEYLLDSALRELQEETGLQLVNHPPRASQVFEHPDRSPLGRVITHAFLFILTNHTTRPSVKGADDATRAFWHPLQTLKSDQLFADHFDIIQTFLEKMHVIT